MRSMAVTLEDSRTRLLLLAQVTITGLLLVGFLLELQAGASAMEHGLLIGAGILVAKYFGKKGDDADEDAQGEHPVARFMFKAMNGGDFKGAGDVVRSRIKGGELVEWRMVLDLTIFNEFRSTVGLPIVE